MEERIPLTLRHAYRNVSFSSFAPKKSQSEISDGTKPRHIRNRLIRRQMKRMGWADISWEAWNTSQGALGRQKVKKVEVTLCELNPEDERFGFLPPIRVWSLFTSKSIFSIRVKTQSRKGYFGFINNTNTSLKFNKKLCLRIPTCHLFCRHPIMSHILCPSHESFIWTHSGLWEKYDRPHEQGWQELTCWVENWLYPWNIFCNIKPTQAHWWVLSFNLWRSNKPKSWNDTSWGRSGTKSVFCSHFCFISYSTGVWDDRSQKALTLLPST